MAYNLTGEAAETFPLVAGLIEHAEREGPCKEYENWGRVLAHAHVAPEEAYGWICVKGPLSNLFNEAGKPTSLFLHEYAHLLNPVGGHDQEFTATNKRLHKQWRVQPQVRMDAIGEAAFELLLLAGAAAAFLAGIVFWGIFLFAPFVLIRLLYIVMRPFDWEQAQYDDGAMGAAWR